MAYGFQHVHMAMTQKEPGPSKKSIVSQCQACQAYTYNSIFVSWRLSRLWVMFGGAILVYIAPCSGGWLLHKRRTHAAFSLLFPLLLELPWCEWISIFSREGLVRGRHDIRWWRAPASWTSGLERKAMSRKGRQPRGAGLILCFPRVQPQTQLWACCGLRTIPQRYSRQKWQHSTKTAGDWIFISITFISSHLVATTTLCIGCYNAHFTD